MRLTTVAALAAALAPALAAAAPKRPLKSATENRVVTLFHTLPALPDLHSRLVAASEIFLGADYETDPLGEGPAALDPDPIYRFDRFDCQTLVETVIALSKADSYPALALRMIEMRYSGGRIAYEERNHFVEAEWVPHNEAAGIFTDITAEIGGGVEKTASVEVALSPLEKDYEEFLKKMGKANWPIGTYSLPYLPLEWAIKNWEKIPEGTVVQVVREPKKGVPHLVTHQGIVLSVGGKKVLRNASSSPKRRKVLDRDLDEYLRFNKRYFSEKGRWKVLGINVLRINDI